ncbi:Histidine kinase 2 [Spatholobus suberectus]|nr:Histidine kinase 2 [Spatholobus suberectus]
MSCLCLLWRSQKQKLVQGHPAAQRKQLQHFVQGSSKGCWERREEMLAKMCDERAVCCKIKFNVSTNHVHALSILVSTFHHGKHPSAIGPGVEFGCIRPVRMHFEKQHGWTIKKMETKNEALFQDCIPEKLDPAPIQDEYAPVIFAQETVSHIVSIDMMSGKDDRENILRARASGKGVLTSPFKLLKSNHLGVVLTIAVYNNNLPLDATPEQRIEATVGMVTQLAMILIDKDAWDKEFIAVESGRAALKMLKPPHNFDACFMDLQMPEMDGFEATRQIRHLESEINEKIACGQASAEMFSNMSYWHIPILAMTADATQDSNEECSKCGMDGYVSKPFEEEQLYMAMARFFKSDSLCGMVGRAPADVFLIETACQPKLWSCLVIDADLRFKKLSMASVLGGDDVSWALDQCSSVLIIAHCRIGGQHKA